MNYYIHIPFCRSKCGYCAFYSIAGADQELIGRYLKKLDEVIPDCRNSEKCETIFVGGGTPTLLDMDNLNLLFEIIHHKFAVTCDSEITIEANPETLDREKLRLLRDNINRISVGVQSFDEKLRRTLGRICDQETLLRTLDMVAGFDFPHWNCDLIYAVPGMSLRDWESDLRKVVEYPVDHVSCYSLTPEEGSILGGKFVIDMDSSDAMYDMAGSILAGADINRYEVSNYAKSNAQCRHNVNIWRGGLLRGFGAGAAGFDGIDRYNYGDSIDDFLAGVPPILDRITPAQRREEIFSVNLRTVAGWSRAMWQAVQIADSWENRREKAALLAEKFPECWDISKENIKLTGRGLRFWDNIAEELLI